MHRRIDEGPVMARGRPRARLRGASSLRSAMTLALAAAMGAGGAVFVERSMSPENRRGVSTVADLLDGRRVANGRLTGGTPFAAYAGPVRPRMRGGVEVAAPGGDVLPSPRRTAQAAVVLAEGVERPTGRALRDVGVLRLAEGRYRLASATLERAREAAPDDARIAADLSVALLEEAMAEDVPRLAARALAVADEAIALDPFVDEAWFTRAAALEHLWIAPAAVQAWRDYLGRDESSPWAAEARRRVCALAQLADPSVRLEARRRFETAIAEGSAELAEAAAREYPSEARRVGTDRLVKDWPAAVLARSDSDGQRVEAELRTAADAIATVQLDRFFVEAVASIRASNAVAQPRRLAEGLAAYGDGREAFRRGEMQLAARHFGVASVQLRAAGSEAVATLAEFDLARCEIYSRGYDSVLRRLEMLRPEAERREYRHLAARARWVAGYVHAVRFEVAPALGQLRLALDGLDATGDIEGSAIVGLLLAETSHWYGLGDDAWDHGRRALAALSRMGSSGQASVTYSGVAILAGAEGETSASKYLLDAAVSSALESGDSVSEAAAYSLRAALSARRGDSGESAASLSAARAAFKRIADPVTAERVLAELELVEGEVSLETSPDQAIDLLTRVLATYVGSGDCVRTVQSLRLRAAAYSVRNDGEAARLDLDAAIRELDAQRRKLRSVEMKATLGHEAAAVFEAAMDLHLDRLGDPDGAFRLSERERTWERVEPRPLPSMDEIAATISERETVLVYTTRADSVGVWTIDRTGTTLERTRIGAARLSEQIERFRRGVEHGDLSELAPLSDPLVEALWRPVEGRIPENATVVIVGEAVLRGLPFGALVDSRTGRFLIQRNAFVVARSAADAAGRREATTVSDGPVLVVGDPEFEPSTHPGLSRLPRAADEARAVASMYGQARVFLAGEATVSAFREGVGKAAIIHYAGHALGDVDGRGEPSLLMAGELLVVSKIAEMRLDGVVLAVLAACGTSANGAEAEGSIGSRSVADAFLDAGVEEVVASHWAVSDDATAELFVEFHRRLRAGESAAAALRGAALSAIGGPEGGGLLPRDWAAFVVCG